MLFNNLVINYIGAPSMLDWALSGRKPNTGFLATQPIANELYCGKAVLFEGLS